MHEVYQRAANISWDYQTATESLILNLEYRHQIVELNSSAALIWQWTNGRSSIKDISQKLSQHYNIPFHNAYADVCEIYEMWQEDELVVLRSDKIFNQTIV
jgi:hypothetical protein